MKSHVFIKWNDKTQKEKKNAIIKLVLLAIFTIGVILTFVFAGKIFGENSVFNRPISEYLAINAIYQAIPKIIRSIQIVVISSLILAIIRLIMRKSFTKTNRGLTIVRLLDSFIKLLIYVIAAMLVLGAWGVDAAALVASAGILGLVIGLGAQSLIADIIAGVFIVFEGSFQVGDIIIIDGYRGTVQEIGVRTTKIIDDGGNIKIVNNSVIKTVINQTQELSVATCTVGIEYGESLERVEGVVNANLENIKAKIPTIVEGPFYKGVKALNSSSVDLLFVAKCKEADIFQTQRDLNREIKLLFDENNINIPFPQIVVNKGVDNNTDIK